MQKVVYVAQKCACGATALGSLGACWDCHSSKRRPRQDRAEISPLLRRPSPEAEAKAPVVVEVPVPELTPMSVSSDETYSAHWTTERVALLKSLLASGLSASNIASELGGVTRNAVIGKVHRMGLRLPGSQSMAATRPRPPKSKASTPPRQPKNPYTSDALRPVASRAMTAFRRMLAEAQPIEIVEEIVVPADKRRGLADIEDRQCRWPIGDPRESDFHFCASTMVPGLPYCEFHARKAFVAKDKPSDVRARPIPVAAGGQNRVSGIQMAQKLETAAGDASKSVLAGVAEAPHGSCRSHVDNDSHLAELPNK